MDVQSACGAQPACVSKAHQFEGLSMVVVHDTVRGRAIRKRRIGRTASAAQARLDPRQGAGVARLCRDPGDRARERAGHRLRGGRLPEYRRVLGEEARHLHDHGRHLHARLRLLQCQDRAAGRARSRPSPSMSREAIAKLGLSHVVITSVDRDDLADGGARAFRASHPRDPRALPDDHDRSADAGFPAQGRRAANWWSRRSPTCSTTISKPCRRSI